MRRVRCLGWICGLLSLAPFVLGMDALGMDARADTPVLVQSIPEGTDLMSPGAEPIASAWLDLVLQSEKP
jgi:hypothetical protein